MYRRSRRGSWTSSAICSTRLAACAALLLGLACAGGRFGGSDAEEQAFAAATARLAGDPAAAQADLEAFLASWPEGERADDARLELGRLRLAGGDPAGATAILAESVRLQPRSDQVDRTRLLLASIEFERGRIDEAMRAASAIRFSRLDEVRRVEAYLLLADLSAARGERVDELVWLGRVTTHVDSGSARVAVSRRIDDIVAQLDAERLAAAAETLGSRPPAVRVHLRRAELAIRGGDLDVAGEELERVAKLGPDPDEETRRQALEARLRARQGLGPEMQDLPGFAEVARLEGPSTEGARGTLGVVLPLSGSFARFGEASLRGVMLAAGVFGSSSDGDGVRLQVRDSRGDPDVAAAAVRELADDPDVVAVIGPLLRSESEAAAGAAERAGVPLLALTPRAEVAQGRDHVFQLALTPRAEVAVVADYAVRELAVERVAILYPEDPYGRGLKNLFWDEVEKRGGSVVGVGRYAPDATDFAKPIRRLVGYLLLTDEEKAALKERKKLLNRAKRVNPERAAELREEAALITGPDESPLPPIVDFDALFIADTHRAVELIAPQLAFHEVGGEVVLLGASGWNHPDLVRIGGRHVEGSVFAESFFQESHIPFVREFRARYQGTFEQDPDATAAQAFDAANVALVQLARGLETRDEMREGLLGVRGHPGVSGVTTIGNEGAAFKRPFLLGVRGGHVVSLD